MDAQTEVKKMVTDWAASRPDEVVFNPMEGYYSSDIIMDAYLKGIEKGEEQERKRGVRNLLIERYRKDFFAKAQELSNSLYRMIELLETRGYNATKVFLNHTLEQSKIILIIKEGTHHTKEFIDFAYAEAIKIENEAKGKLLTLNIGFIEQCESLNVELLKNDGFDIGYDFNKSAPIE